MIDFKVYNKSGVWLRSIAAFALVNTGNGERFEPGVATKATPCDWIDGQAALVPCDDPLKDAKEAEAAQAKAEADAADALAAQVKAEAAERAASEATAKAIAEKAATEAAAAAAAADKAPAASKK